MSKDDYAHDFDAMFAHMTRRSHSDRFIPNVDIFTDTEQTRVIVHIEVAGADRDSLNIEADDRMLYIAGQRMLQNPPRALSCLLKEIEYGAFERQVHLPFAIDHDQTTAQYDDGILRIELLAQTNEVPAIVRTEIRLVFRRTQP